jgi:hypothetical protein
MAMIATAEKFLAKHIGGRYQESMTPEVATRLKEITVDVKTVALAKRVEAPAGTPQPTADLKPGKANYAAKIEVNGQSIPIQVVVEIAEDGGLWKASEIAQTPVGEVTDTTRLAKGSLQLQKRSIRQGPLAIEVDFKDGKANGTMSMNGQERPIAADTGGALFADGAGAYIVMATLPLKEGYTTTFRNFDVQGQKTALKQLKVIAVESVTVPAGTFEAYKIELTSATGDPGKSTTVWVAKDSRQVVKIAAMIPQNGATITTELTK